VIAGAAAVPAATGCTTHQCDQDCIQFGELNGTLAANCAAGNPDVAGNAQPIGAVSQDLDDLVWESSSMTGPWLDFPGGRTYIFFWPPAFAGVTPYQITPMVSTMQYAQSPGAQSILGTGQVSVLSGINGLGITVYNDSCAEYFLRVEARAHPPSVTMFGGQGASVLGDVWRYDNLANWTLVEPSNPSPAARLQSAVASVNGTVVLFSGSDGSNPLGDTWLWDGVTWTEQFPTSSPSPRSGASMAALNGQAILFGGFDGSQRLADTWAWDGTNWTQLSLSPSPPARSDAAMALAFQSLVLFGGTDGTNALGDTWALSATDDAGDLGWTQVSGSPAPPARRDAAFATSSAPGALGAVLFGGSDGTNALGDTWLWNGGSWTQETTTVQPAARDSAAAAQLGTSVVLFGGRDGTGKTLGDTWVWDGASWTARSPASPPPARLGAALVTF
jgi:hypothetical protein